MKQAFRPALCIGNTLPITSAAYRQITIKFSGMANPSYLKEQDFNFERELV